MVADEMLLIAVKIGGLLNSLSFCKLLGNFPLEEHGFIVVSFEDSFFVLSEKAGRNTSAEVESSIWDVWCKGLGFSTTSTASRQKEPQTQLWQFMSALE